MVQGGLPSAELVDRALFPAPAATYAADSYPGELIWIPGYKSLAGEAVDDRIPCLLLRSPAARYFVLAIHSNGDDLGRFRNFCSRLRLNLAVHVLAVEYPGYGICPGGQATPTSATANAMAAFRFLREELRWPEEEIIVFGRSIGCGPALHVATTHPAVHGVILVSPFASVQELLRRYVGPLADFVAERFPNRELIKRVTSRLLLVHGKMDKMVPYEHGVALYEACMCQKLLVTPEDMGHNTNLHANENYLIGPMFEFFKLRTNTRKPVLVPDWAFEDPLARHGEEGFFGYSVCCLRDSCRFRDGQGSGFSKTIVCGVPTSTPPPAWPMASSAVKQPQRDKRVRPLLPQQLAASEVLPQPRHSSSFSPDTDSDDMSAVMDADAAGLEAAAREDDAFLGEHSPRSWAWGAHEQDYLPPPDLSMSIDQCHKSFTMERASVSSMEDVDELRSVRAI